MTTGGDSVDLGDEGFVVVVEVAEFLDVVGGGVIVLESLTFDCSGTSGMLPFPLVVCLPGGSDVVCGACVPCITGAEDESPARCLCSSIMYKVVMAMRQKAMMRIRMKMMTCRNLLPHILFMCMRLLRVLLLLRRP